MTAVSSIPSSVEDITSAWLASALGAGDVEIVSADPAPPRELDENIPAELERICLKALQKKPRDRYQSISDLVRDIDAILNEALMRESV